MLGGEREIKAQGGEYLPRLVEQMPEDYMRYKTRAQFVDIARRTHEALVGHIFSVDPQYIFPDSLTSFMDDATLAGESYYDWLKDAARAVLGVGRRGTLIDWDDAAERPYLAAYEAEDIFNWRMGRVGNQMVLTMLVLREESEVSYGIEALENDPFLHKQFEQFRLYEILNDEMGNPFVSRQLWRKAEPATAQQQMNALPGTGPEGAVGASSAWFIASGFIMVEETFPARGIGGLTRIPFVFHGANNFLPAVDVAPMEGIATANVSHYRTSADLEHGLHFTALPTPWAKGFGDNAQKMPLGGSVIWSSDKEWASCGYLEFSGSGLKMLVDSLERKEGQMAALGSRMFDADQGKAGEAYDTVRIRQTGETITLASIAIALGQSATRVLQWAAWWLTRSIVAPEDLGEDASVEMNTTFIQNDIQPEKISAIVSAWQQRAISRKTMFFNFKQGQLYPQDVDMDQEQAEIEDEAAQMQQEFVDQQLAQTGGADLPFNQPDTTTAEA